MGPSSPMCDRCGRTDEGRAPSSSRAFTPVFQPSALAMADVAVVMEAVAATVSISELTDSIGDSACCQIVMQSGG